MKEIKSQDHLDAMARQGTPRREPSPADRLADAADAAFGEHWRRPLAEELDINEATIWRWMSGKTPLPEDHGVFRDVLALLDRRIAEIKAERAELSAWMERVENKNLRVKSKIDVDSEG